MSFQSAHKAYEAGRFDTAETLLSAHLNRDPNDAMGMHLGALIAQKRGDFRTAFTRIKASMHDATNLHEKHNTFGNILRALGRDVAAMAAFKAALNDRPDYQVARMNLARLQFETARYPEAAEQYSAAIKHDASNLLAWRGRINVCLQAQDLDEAHALLKTAPLPDVEKAGLAARIAFYRGETDTVLKAIHTHVSDPANGSDSLSLALQVLHMTGRWGEAMTFTKDILSRFPNRADLWGCAAQSFRQAGDVKATAALLADAPAGVPIDLIKIDMLTAQSDFAEAQALAIKALQKDPGHDPLMKLLCQAALGNHDFDLAQRVADFGLQTRPNDQFYYAIKATAGRSKEQNYRYYFDYERYVKPFDLDPPAGWSDITAFNADLKKALISLHRFKAAPLDQTLRLGTQTAPNLKYVDHPVIRAFFDAVDPAIRSYLGSIGNDPQHVFQARNLGGYHIYSAWSVRLGRGGHHVNHIHPKGWISSAYYVDVPNSTEPEGWIKFGEPPSPLNRALGHEPEHRIKPVAGRLVLFPSYMWHGTYPITGDKTRLTLPIDILPDTP